MSPIENPPDPVVGNAIVRCNTFTLTILELTKTITFSSALPTTNYQLFFNNNGLNVALAVTNKTTTGFSLSISVGVVGTVSYLAVMNT